LEDISDRSIATNSIETYFGKLTQMLHYKPFMSSLHATIIKVEHFPSKSLAPFSARQFYIPDSAEKHYYYADLDGDKKVEWAL
jgi:hypothetical protein